MSFSRSTANVRLPIRRALAALALVIYLATHAVFLLLSALGDPRFFPASYFFTWDMFPSYYTESSRRVAVGQTASGRYVELVPSPFQQYWGGVHGDLTHVDLERRGVFYRAAVEQTLQKIRPAADDPVQQVWIFEKFWPVKFNYPDDLYVSWFAGPKPDRRCWRLVGAFDVVDGQLAIPHRTGASLN